MSTGKRLAKRSILGTRVAACRTDGLYHAGVICGTRMVEGRGTPLYSVRFEGTRYVVDFGAADIVGPGFLAVCDVRLPRDQPVHVTHNGRETPARVLQHDTRLDEVLLQIKPNTDTVELKKRVDEIRLWESRKSPRLADSDTDFARLADVGLEKSRRSPSIDANNLFSCRKRRSSPPMLLLSPDGVPGEMNECTAAMVLMSLSVSPKSPRLSNDSVSWSDQMSVGSTSGSDDSSPALSELVSQGGSVDEGIDMEDDREERKRQSSTQTVYKCTWPKCRMLTSTCSAIEKHVRNEHLGPAGSDQDSDLSDHEEEFYYTEIEVSRPTPHRPQQLQPPPQPAAEPPTLSHMDMARPPHEDPQLQSIVSVPRAPGTSLLVRSAAIPVPQQHRHSWPQHPAVYSTTPYGHKYIRLGPKAFTTHPKLSSHHRRARADVKKCRKVYGMEHREQWCTQCKWKKACTRFSEGV